MSDAAISIRGLSKRYALGGRESYQTAREAVMSGVRRATGWARRPRAVTSGTAADGRGEAATLWALRDVSFDVRPGEVVGIVGRNGAGKSTLLKVLSRVTSPTAGSVEMTGRVGSLLEVGTGFHPELTGRENIYLNGAILGMSRAEVRKQFDAIVEFAGVGKFLDTPVKRYSSGMYMRLAFSVAAHLDSEILIVDEVLAVGDATFQKKCLGKMREISTHGRTVLFVSHSMPAILNLCQSVILLDQGSLVARGAPQESTRLYLSQGASRAAERVWATPGVAPGDQTARLRAVRVRNAAGEVAESIDVAEAFAVEVEYWNMEQGRKPTVSLQFFNEDGVLLFVSNDFNNERWWSTPRDTGVVRAACRVPPNLLAEGTFFVLAAVCSYDPDEIHALEKDAVAFQVTDARDAHRLKEKYARPWPGAMRPHLDWVVSHEGPAAGATA